MLMIRLKRVGRRNQTSFRLVVTEKTAGAHAQPIEFLGSWNPRTKAVTLKRERILHWLSQGAKPSPTVHNLLIAHGVIEGAKIAVHKKVKEEVKTEAAPTAEAAPPEGTPPETQAETPAPEATP